jgi:CPA1 family monovalent cation:H+ antiporter
MGNAVVMLRAWLISIGDDEPMIMVGIQLLTPLIVYLAAETWTFSGILAVVSAGLVQGIERDRLRLTSAKMQIVSANVWQMLSQMLSGLIFVLLGLSLPNVVTTVIREKNDLFVVFVGIGFFIYVAKSIVRFLWSRLFVKMSSKNQWQKAFILMLGGANGTITLALAFSLPDKIFGSQAFLRQGLILTAATVILLSLIVPTTLLPFLVKRPQKHADHYLWVHRMISSGINALRDETQHQNEAQIVIDAISQELFLQDKVPRTQERHLFEATIAVEKGAIKTLLEQKKVTPDEFGYYLQFMNLTAFTADQKLWKNAWLRIKFALHTGKLYRTFSDVQDAFLTTPLNLEPIYWRRQFKAHGENLVPIENVGYEASVKYLRQNENQLNRKSINHIRSYYRNRHRHVQYDAFDSEALYTMFLKLFHAEYEYIQESFTTGKINMTTMQRLQTRLTLQEMTYLQNQQTLR